MIEDVGEFRRNLGNNLQIELRDGGWITHVNQDTLRNEFDAETNHFVTSKENGINIFNRVSEEHGVKPLRDPSGYMALDGNVQSYMRNTYKDRYQETLYNIDDYIVDGTGYGVEAVLDKLDSVIRKDMRDILPEDMNYGDLRFVEAGPEEREAVDELVGARVSKTLAFEKKRSYEESSLERIDNRLEDAGKNLTKCLEGISNDPVVSL